MNLKWNFDRKFNFKILSYVRASIDGIGLVTGFIEHLYTQLVTTSTYSATASLHTLQITRAHVKSSQAAFISWFLVTDLNNGDSSASVLMSLPAG
jgi:hypothetical protein